MQKNVIERTCQICGKVYYVKGNNNSKARLGSKNYHIFNLRPKMAHTCSKVCSKQYYLVIKSRYNKKYKKRKKHEREEKEKMLCMRRETEA